MTAIDGGEGYSVVPDRCVVSVDCRVTPGHDAGWAERLVRELCRSLDDEIPTRRPTIVEAQNSWPAYRLPPTSRPARPRRLPGRRERPAGGDYRTPEKVLRAMTIRWIWLVPS